MVYSIGFIAGQYFICKNKTGFIRYLLPIISSVLLIVTVLFIAIISLSVQPLMDGAFSGEIFGSYIVSLNPSDSQFLSIMIGLIMKQVIPIIIMLIMAKFIKPVDSKQNINL